MQIGNKLKRLRELKNLNQEEVAQKLNITKQAYSKIERNETKLDLERIMDLAEIFEIKPEDLLREDNINLNFAKECDSNQFSGTGTIHNNYYYGTESAPMLQKTIEAQQETIKRLEAEIAFLRKMLEEQINSQNRTK
jgi:transcriptional regulator with XRE-family HTH domain